MGRVSSRRSRSYNVSTSVFEHLVYTNYDFVPSSSRDFPRFLVSFVHWDLVWCYKRIVVAKQRVPETSISVRCFIHKEGGIRDHTRERWRDPSVMRVVSPRRPKNDRRAVSPFEDSNNTRREVGWIKPLSRTNMLTLFITE